jgi:hypothetical protein
MVALTGRVPAMSEFKWIGTEDKGKEKVIKYQHRYLDCSRVATCSRCGADILSRGG